MDSKL